MFWSTMMHASKPHSAPGKDMRLGFAGRYVPTCVAIYPDTEDVDEYGGRVSLKDYGAVLVAGVDTYTHNRKVPAATRGRQAPARGGRCPRRSSREPRRGLAGLVDTRAARPASGLAATAILPCPPSRALAAQGSPRCWNRARGQRSRGSRHPCS